MDSVVDVLWVVAGAAVVVLVIDAVLRGFVLPRASVVFLTRLVWISTRLAFDAVVKLAKTYERQDTIMAMYAPLSLLVLPAVWIVLVIGGFMMMFHGLGVESWRTAFEQSGSSVLTLGFASPTNIPTSVLTFSEAAIGLGLLALLIAYLPSIYAAFSRREVQVAQLSALAGTPPSPTELFIRVHRIGRLDELEGVWVTWQTWFAEVEETHTTQPALVFFRSPRSDRSWLTASGALLDTASLYLAVIDVERSADAALCIRAGYSALRSVASFFSIPFDPDPRPTDPTSIAREEFDDVCRQIAEAGVPLKPDLDQAWRDYNGWRVNYDAVLLALCALTMAPYAMWSSDRSLRRRLPPLRPGLRPL